jgi:hypothetical protein
MELGHLARLARLPELGQGAGTRVGQGAQPGFLLYRQLRLFMGSIDRAHLNANVTLGAGLIVHYCLIIYHADSYYRAEIYATSTSCTHLIVNLYHHTPPLHIME